VNVEIELITPIAMEKTMRFAIREVDALLARDA